MQDLVPCPGIKPWPPALGVQSVKCWSTQEVPLGGYITGPKAEVFKKWPLSLFKKKKNLLTQKLTHVCMHIYGSKSFNMYRFV